MKRLFKESVLGIYGICNTYSKIYYIWDEISHMYLPATYEMFDAYECDEDKRVMIRYTDEHPLDATYKSKHISMNAINADEHKLQVVSEVVYTTIKPKKPYKVLPNGKGERAFTSKEQAAYDAATAKGQYWWSSIKKELHFFTFNLDNGQAYHICEGKIQNITYANLTHQMRDYLYNDTVAWLNENCTCNYSLLNIKNRFQNADEHYIKPLMRYYKNYLSKFDKYSTQYDVFNGLCIKLGITTKQLKKDVAADPENLLMVSVLKDIGITDVNLLHSLLNIQSGKQLQFTYVRNIGIAEGQYLVNKYGQKKIANAIMERPSDVQYIDDIYLYLQQLERKNFEIPKFKGSLYAFHNALMDAAEQLRYANIPLIYTNTEIAKFNKTIGIYDFRLSEDTDTMLRNGNYMGICVGTNYRDGAIADEYKIVFMYWHNKPVGCLQIIKNYQGKYCLIQAKAKYNNLLQEDKALALKQYVETLKLNVQTSDYWHISRAQIEFDPNKIYPNTMRYDLALPRNRDDLIIDDDEEEVFLPF